MDKRQKSISSQSPTTKCEVYFANPLSTKIQESANDTSTGIKRALSETTSSAASEKVVQPSKIHTSKMIGKHTAKKPKNNSHTEISTDELVSQLMPTEDLIEANTEKYPLNFDDITNLLQSTYNNTNVLKVTSSYSADTKALTIMLTDIKEIATERKIKNRIDRILKKLQYAETNDGFLSESAASTFED